MNAQNFRMKINSKIKPVATKCEYVFRQFTGTFLTVVAAILASMTAGVAEQSA